jgi:hypothetical protein
MRESRTYGSVRGALRNERPYRDRFARNDGSRDTDLTQGHHSYATAPEARSFWIDASS